MNASKKKLYMLYDIEPDTSVTGGTWYSNQDFEVEFVDVLNQQCFRFLDERVRCILNFKKNFFVVEKLEINHFYPTPVRNTSDDSTSIQQHARIENRSQFEIEESTGTNSIILCKFRRNMVIHQKSRH